MNRASAPKQQKAQWLVDVILAWLMLLLPEEEVKKESDDCACVHVAV